MWGFRGLGFNIKKGDWISIGRWCRSSPCNSKMMRHFWIGHHMQKLLVDDVLIWLLTFHRRKSMIWQWVNEKKCMYKLQMFWRLRIDVKDKTMQEIELFIMDLSHKVQCLLYFKGFHGKSQRVGIVWMKKMHAQGANV